MQWHLAVARKKSNLYKRCSLLLFLLTHFGGNNSDNSTSWTLRFIHFQIGDNPVRSRAIHCPFGTCDNARRIWASAPQTRTTTNLPSNSKWIEHYALNGNGMLLQNCLVQFNTEPWLR